LRRIEKRRVEKQKRRLEELIRRSKYQGKMRRYFS
jgi:hypothetical protein